LRGLELESPLGDVVDDRIARDVIQRLVLGHVFGARADDDSDLDLVVEFRGASRLLDVVVRTADAGRGLHEHDRLGGYLQARLVRMVDVVQADRDELGDASVRDTEARIAANERQRLGTNLAKLRQALRRNYFLVDVGNHAGKIAQLALRIDDAWLLEPVPAVTTKLHFSCFLSRSSGTTARATRKT
jgi:predicted nucleotidyltransferase